MTSSYDIDKLEYYVSNTLNKPIYEYTLSADKTDLDWNKKFYGVSKPSISDIEAIDLQTAKKHKKNRLMPFVQVAIYDTENDIPQRFQQDGVLVLVNGTLKVWDGSWK